MAPGCRKGLSIEHQRQLLELANSQHLEWQRLLEQLSEESERNVPLHIINEVPAEEGLYPPALSVKDINPGRMLSNTSTVQPEPLHNDAFHSFEAVEVGAVNYLTDLTKSKPKSRSGTPSSDDQGRMPLTLTLKSNEEAQVEAFRVTEASAGEPLPKSQWLRWIKPRLNYIAGTLVVLNTILMFLELEFEGNAAAREIGLSTSGPEHSAYAQFFRVLDGFFDCAFLLEICVRIAMDGSGWRFFCRTSNQLELVLVIVGMVDFFMILMAFQGVPDDFVMLHLFRSAHALRALRTCRLFKGLRVLLRACEAFISSLFWAMVLLLIFMCAGSILMGNLLQSFILRDANLDDRTWIWEHYGTAYRCWYTLYELTFAGNWPTRARPVTDLVDPRFAIFFFTYITVVSFAMIRVVTAVFLKDTLEAAQNDQELQLLNQLKKKAEYVKKLEHIFKTIDDGNGIINEERLLAVMADPQVMAHLQTLELDVHEGTALFHLLDNGDGEVTLEEFIDGILRCKGPARAVDQVAMRAEIRQMDAKIMKVLRLMVGELTRASSFDLDHKSLQIDVSSHLLAFSDARPRLNRNGGSHPPSRQTSKGTSPGIPPAPSARA